MARTQKRRREEGLSVVETEACEELLRQGRKAPDASLAKELRRTERTVKDQLRRSAEKLRRLCRLPASVVEAREVVCHAFPHYANRLKASEAPSEGAPLDLTAATHQGLAVQALLRSNQLPENALSAITRQMSTTFATPGPAAFRGGGTAFTARILQSVAEREHRTAEESVADRKHRRARARSSVIPRRRS